MEYNNSKKAGDIIEEEILSQIQKKYPKAYIDDRGKANSDWDIYIPEIKEGIEVKGDYKSAETGNLVVEVEMNGKPSALSVTKAKYWIFVEGYRKIWIKPIDIYRFIEQNGLTRANFTGIGDTKSKFAYLVNHKDFVLHAWDVGKVEIIDKDSPIYYNNYTKRLDLLETNKIMP